MAFMCESLGIWNGAMTIHFLEAIICINIRNQELQCFPAFVDISCPVY